MDKCIISFIWMDNGWNINGQGFNFESGKKFRIINDIKNDYINLIEENVMSVPNDFFGSSISLTAIVGENGAGKSSLIRFIRENISENTFLREGYIIIYKVDDNYKIYHNMTIDIKYTDVMGNEYIIKNDFLNSKDLFSAWMFLSNIFDGQNERCPENSIYRNNSLNNLVRKDLSFEKENNPILDTIVEDAIGFIQDDDFKSLMEREIEALTNALIISINENFLYELNRKLRNIDGKWYQQQFEKNSSLLMPPYNINRKRFFALCVDEFGLVDEARACYEAAINRLGLNLWIMLRYLLKTKNAESDIFDNYYTDIAKNEEKNQSALTILMKIFNDNCIELERFKGIKDFIESMINILTDNKFIKNYRSTEIVIKFDDYKFSEEYHKLYEQIKSVIDFKIPVPFAYLKWGNYGKGGFSTGELFRLRIYTELYKLKKEINQKNNKNIVIFIDEWNLYMHPSMQRKGIRDLLKFIDIIFRGYYVQLILTSNEPFLLSDVPLSNVIFLKNGKIIEKTSQTFAANIHTILKDDFFMDSTIGEFAKNKINDVITFLQSEKQKRKRNRNYITNVQVRNNNKYIIDLIGEPIIRCKLERMYYETFPEDLYMKEQIKMYKNKIIKLQNEIINGKMIDEKELKALREELNKTIERIDDIVKDSDDI